MTTEKTESINLYFRKGNSDKVYQVHLVRTPEGFMVNYFYGRRNSALRSGTKTPKAVSYAEAKKIYDRVVGQQLREGYTEKQDGVPYQDYAGPQQHSGIEPVLLNPIEEWQVGQFIEDSSWHMQEKKDGIRLLVRSSGEQIEGINRKGSIVPLPKVVEQAVRSIGKNVLLDGELVGSTYWTFDVLAANGEDLRACALDVRLCQLSLLVQESRDHMNLQLVPSVSVPSEKRALFERLKVERAEGVTFKRCDAKYVSGRPNSGGHYLKFKFTQAAVCVVLRVNKGRRSVGLGVGSRANKVVEIGNLTIPPNACIPAEGRLVEVRYLYRHPQGSLYQPVYVRERTDVDTADLVDSLKVKAGEDDDAGN